MIPTKIVSRFAASKSIPFVDAQRLYNELEEFLAQAGQMAVTPTQIMDEAWHAFILHTKEYADYCSNEFGRFIHHLPNDTKEVSGGNCSSNCNSSVG